MYSENGVLVEIDEVTKLIDTADVFAVGFSAFDERLLVDVRSNDTETPLVQVVQPKNSAQERVRWLNRRRPSLGTPQTLSFVSWPHSPAFLVESGVWERIRSRVGSDADRDVETQCRLALQRLESLDRKAIVDLIIGEKAITLWPTHD